MIIGNTPTISVSDPLTIVLQSAGKSFSGIWEHTTFIKLLDVKSSVATFRIK